MKTPTKGLQLWNQEFWGLFRMATPLALAQAGQALMGLVDMVVVARVSDEAQAAVGLGNALFFVFAVFGMATLSAVDPLVSQAVGAKEPATARTHFWQGVAVSCALGLLLCLPVLASSFLLERFGVEPQVAQLARAYIWARLWSLPAMLLFSNCRAYFQGINKPSLIFYAVLVSNLLNAAAVVVFVHGFGPIPAMGAVGAGVATALCTWAGVGVLLMGMGPRPEGVKRRPSWPAGLHILRLGVPLGLHAVSEVSIIALMGIFASTLSPAASAAHYATMTWMSFSFCFALGLGNAASVRIGWAVGRGDFASLRRIGAVAMASSIVLMAPWTVLFSAFPRLPASLTTDSPETLALALPLFVIGGFFQLMDGLGGVSAGLLRGAGDTKPAFYVTMLGYYAVAAPIGMYLALQGMGVKGLWWGTAVGVMLIGPALAARFYWRISKPLARV